MMKRFTTLFLMLAVVLVAVAQAKLTPQAQMKVNKQLRKAERSAARAKANGLVAMPQAIRLVVKVADAGKAATAAEIRKRGAHLEGRIGNQVVVQLPVDSVESLSRINGVVRIDVCHKGKLNTDISREETGVNQLNGPAATLDVPVTGKGVTVAVLDVGIDFQHRAFKDSEGRSRIKAVYVPSSNKGRKFSYDDPDFGEIEFPGSVFDTPELIATLTTDHGDDMHGTHTVGIAAGSISPQGFGGMAPEADIVLVPMGFLEEAVESGMADQTSRDDILELCLSFLAAYAQSIEGPMVVSASLNSHDGPHNGTGTVPEAIAALSEYAIPVFSTGNEGDVGLHVHYVFGNEVNPMRLQLPIDFEYEGDEDGGDDDDFEFESEDSEWDDDADGDSSIGTKSGFVGASRADATEGQSLTIQPSLYNAFSGTTLWTGDQLTVTADEETHMETIHSDLDEDLSEYFDGSISLVGTVVDGKFVVKAQVDGRMLEEDVMNIASFMLSVTGSDGLDMDFWEPEGNAFLGTEEDGCTLGDKDLTAGDWTSTPSVISVGAYCTNEEARTVSGEDDDDFSFGGDDDDDDEYPAELGYICDFSSYGAYPNGVNQPTVCAPGKNIVSAWNSYECGDNVAEEMLWDGSPYGSESGTSMSCPTVAGIIALWLEACPTLTLDKVKEVLENSSANDDFTATDPVRWGYGKIDAVAGLEYIQENITGIKTLENRTISTSGDCYDLQGRKIVNDKWSKSPMQPGIYIVNGRKVVVK